MLKRNSPGIRIIGHSDRQFGEGIVDIFVSKGDSGALNKAITEL